MDREIALCALFGRYMSWRTFSDWCRSTFHLFDVPSLYPVGLRSDESGRTYNIAVDERKHSRSNYDRRMMIMTSFNLWKFPLSLSHIDSRNDSKSADFNISERSLIERCIIRRWWIARSNVCINWRAIQKTVVEGLRSARHTEPLYRR